MQAEVVMDRLTRSEFGFSILVSSIDSMVLSDGYERKFRKLIFPWQAIFANCSKWSALKVLQNLEKSAKLGKNGKINLLNLRSTHYSVIGSQNRNLSKDPSLSRRSKQKSLIFATLISFDPVNSTSRIVILWTRFFYSI